MLNFIKEMLSSSTSVSSTRIINFIGAINGGLLVAYETYRTELSPELLGVYLAYCGGVYGVGKYLGSKDA